jgi:hypothetical protein
MQRGRARNLACVQRTLGRMQHAENFCCSDDRTDGLSGRADLGDLGGLGGSGRPRSVLFDCNYRCRHSSSRRRCEYMLQTAPDQLNQKHMSSMEDISLHRVELAEATAPP